MSGFRVLGGFNFRAWGLVALDSGLTELRRLCWFSFEAFCWKLEAKPYLLLSAKASEYSGRGLTRRFLGHHIYSYRDWSSYQ